MFCRPWISQYRRSHKPNFLHGSCTVWCLPTRAKRRFPLSRFVTLSSSTERPLVLLDALLSLSHHYYVDPLRIESVVSRIVSLERRRGREANRLRASKGGEPWLCYGGWGSTRWGGRSERARSPRSSSRRTRKPARASPWRCLTVPPSSSTTWSTRSLPPLRLFSYEEKRWWIFGIDLLYRNRLRHFLFTVPCRLRGRFL